MLISKNITQSMTGTHPCRRLRLAAAPSHRRQAGTAHQDNLRELFHANAVKKGGEHKASLPANPTGCQSAYRGRQALGNQLGCSISLKTGFLSGGCRMLFFGAQSVFGRSPKSSDLPGFPMGPATHSMPAISWRNCYTSLSYVTRNRQLCPSNTAADRRPVA